MTDKKMQAINERLKIDYAVYEKIHSTDPNRSARFDVLPNEIVYTTLKYKDPAEAIAKLMMLAWARGARYQHSCDTAKGRIKQHD